MKKTRFIKKAYLILILVFLCANLSGCESYVVKDFLKGDFKRAMIEMMEGHPWESASERLAKEQTIVRNSTDNNDDAIKEKEESSQKKKENNKDSKKKKDKEVSGKETENNTEETSEKKTESRTDDELIGKSSFTYKEISELRDKIEREKNLNYYYNQLSESKKDLYAQLYAMVVQFRGEETLISADVDTVDEVFLCVINDHPEIYYVTGYSMNEYRLGDSTDSLTFYATYTRNAEEVESLNKEVGAKIEECLQHVPDGDDYEKIKYVYDYIIKNTEYDVNSPDNQNILSVFLNGVSVCQGYAKAAQLLLDRLGIPCILVSGKVSSGESHAWNIVKADGKWCYLDTTWGDSSYTGNVNTTLPDVNYNYLCTNSYWMDKTHHMKTKYNMPSCESLDEFYFVREGTYFTWFDEDKLHNIIVDYTNRGMGSVMIKCESASVYHEMIRELFTRGKITDYIYGAESVGYLRMDDTYNLVIYLQNQ